MPRTIKHNDSLSLNEKSIAALDRRAANAPPILIAGKPKTPAELKAVLQAESAAIRATNELYLRWRAAALVQRTASEAARATRAGLRAFLLVAHGADDFSALGEFGFQPPKRAKPSAATAAQAVEKAKATRAARHTMGKRQRLAIKAPTAPTAAAFDAE